MDTTSDSFFDGLVCGLLAADSGSVARWSWRDLAVLLAVVAVTALAVGVPVWLLCR